MHQRVAQTLRYLAMFINQRAALANAAEGSAALRQRRRDNEDVEKYLQARAPDLPMGQTTKAQ